MLFRSLEIISLQRSMLFRSLEMISRERNNIISFERNDFELPFKFLSNPNASKMANDISRE